MKLAREALWFGFIMIILATAKIIYELWESGWMINASGLQIVVAVATLVAVWRFGIWPAFRHAFKLINKEIEKETKK